MLDLTSLLDYVFLGRFLLDLICLRDRGVHLLPLDALMSAAQVTFFTRVCCPCHIFEFDVANLSLLRSGDVMI